MGSIGTGYDLSASTYSPDGRVFQVEYASKAVDNSGTAVGIRVKDGVVLGVEKLVPSKLLAPGSNRRIHSADMHVGIAIAGLTADGKHLVNRIREEASSYRDIYRTPIPGKMIADRAGLFVQAYTLYSSVRPFGVNALIATMDEYHGPQLFMVEPSGLYWGYHGCAAGKGKQVAKTEIEKLKLNEMTARDAVKAVAKIIYTAHDDSKDRDFELELSWVCTESNMRHELVPKDVYQEAEQYAKDSLRDEMED